MLKDLLLTSDLSPRDVGDLIDLAASFERRPRRAAPGPLAGQLVVVYLTEAAPETVRTYTAAASLHGAGMVVLGPEEYRQGHGASVAGVARAVSLCAAVVVAVTDDVDLRRLAAAATVPIVDGRLGDDAPCSLLAAVLEERSRCPVLDRPRVTEVVPPDVVDLVHGSGGGGGAGAAAAGPHASHASSADGAVLTAVDRRTRRAVALDEPPAPCTCVSHGDRDRHRVHSAAALLLALHRRQLAGR